MTRVGGSSRGKGTSAGPVPDIAPSIIGADAVHGCRCRPSSKAYRHAFGVGASGVAGDVGGPSTAPVAGATAPTPAPTPAALQAPRVCAPTPVGSLRPQDGTGISGPAPEATSARGAAPPPSSAPTFRRGDLGFPMASCGTGGVGGVTSTGFAVATGLRRPCAAIRVVSMPSASVGLRAGGSVCGPSATGPSRTSGGTTPALRRRPITISRSGARPLALPWCLGATPSRRVAASTVAGYGGVWCLSRTRGSTVHGVGGRPTLP